jgi:glycosyltransferase involved in cell wall biosynthesis
MPLKVSVVMAVFNGEKYLREAIESILNQTLRDFEFIIVDDGSNDGTPGILREYKEKDNRIKIITNKENIGLTKSLNKAIKVAKGEYIARQDADDISLPERLEKQVDFLDKNRNVGVVGTFYYEINKEGKVIGRKTFPCDNERLRKSLIKYNPFFHGSVMIRKEVFLKVGLYNENFKKAQDYEFWFRVANFYKLANIPEFLTKRRYIKEMISYKEENEQIYWALKARKEVIKKKQYSKLKYIYLLRPFLVSKTPFTIRQFLRKLLTRKALYD